MLGMTEIELCKVEGGKVKLLAAPVVGGCGYILLVPGKQRADGASWQRCANSIWIGTAWNRMEQHEKSSRAKFQCKALWKSKAMCTEGVDRNSWPARLDLQRS